MIKIVKNYNNLIHEEKGEKKVNEIKKKINSWWVHESDEGESFLVFPQSLHEPDDDNLLDWEWSSSRLLEWIIGWTNSYQLWTLVNQIDYMEIEVPSYLGKIVSKLLKKKLKNKKRKRKLINNRIIIQVKQQYKSY